MGQLAGPMEVLDLPDRGILRTRILRWEEGEAEITTRTTPGQKVVEILRIHVPAETKKVGVPYWDITSKTLRAQLLPLLPGIVENGREVKIQKYGFAPSARFSLDVT